MEHMSKEEALRKCAEFLFEYDALWESMEWDIQNLETHELWEKYHEESELYWASVAIDRIEFYLKFFHDKMEQYGKTQNVKMCRDCYDYATAEDSSVLEGFIYNYGDDAEKIYKKVKTSVEHIEKFGRLLYEVPELSDTFSIYACECCGSKLHGERFFMVYNVNQE